MGRIEALLDGRALDGPCTKASARKQGWFMPYHLSLDLSCLLDIDLFFVRPAGGLSFIFAVSGSLEATTKEAGYGPIHGTHKSLS